MTFMYWQQKTGLAERFFRNKNKQNILDFNDRGRRFVFSDKLPTSILSCCLFEMVKVNDKIRISTMDRSYRKGDTDG